MDWITILISIPLGAVSSSIAWWFLNHWIKPKIKFSNDISKLNKGAKPTYRMKFENSGRRAIVDSYLIAKLRIKGLQFKSNWEVIYLPLDNDYLPKISPLRGQAEKIREVPRLELELIDVKYQRNLPQEIKDRISNGTILLEDLMKLGDRTELSLFITGYDSITGTKHTFISKPYKMDDIKEGTFNNRGLDVVISQKSEEKN